MKRIYIRNVPPRIVNLPNPSRKKKIQTKPDVKDPYLWWKRMVRKNKLNKLLRARSDYMKEHMTDAELKFWELLGPLRKIFKHQWYISPYILDFYCKAGRFAVEIDGSSHNRRKRYDMKRDAAFLLKGIKTIRFSNDQVMNDPSSVLPAMISVLDEKQKSVIRTRLNKYANRFQSLNWILKES